MKLNTLVSLIAAAFAAPAALASTQGVVISQVYGGGGNSGATVKNDFIELFNAGSAPVNVGGWSVQYASSGGNSWQVTNLPNKTLQPGQYLLVQEAQGAGGTQNLPTPDATGEIPMSGTAGKVALVTSTTALTVSNPTGASIVDFVGFGGANFSEGSPIAGVSNTLAARRAAEGCTDTNNNASDFSVLAPSPRNTATALHVCGGGNPGINQPIVVSCPDATATAGTTSLVMATATDIDSIVNAATISGSWPTGFSLGTFSAATVDGGQATQQIQVASTVVAGSYTLNLQWANNEAQTASCSVKVSVAGLTPIYSIQGSGATSPFNNQTVTTRGVVTQVQATGFYLQDLQGDGNPATSDGIFVYTATTPTVSKGQLVKLGGKVSEFNTGAANNSYTLAHTITELTAPSGLTVEGTGYAITPVEVDLASLPTDGLEAYEGMLVTVRGPLTVQQNYFLGRYGQLTIAAGGRVETPTNRFRPGPDAQALLEDNQRRSILLDDGSTAQNPNPTPYIGADNTVRAGDTTGAITGVIDYGLATSSNTGFGAYKIHPVAAPAFVRSNPRPAAPAASGGNVRVASANVLNFFTTFTDGKNAAGQSGQGCSLGGGVSAGNCRGADSLAEFQRQRAKTVNELSALDADVVGLMEIQNNGNTAVQNLVDGLNAKLGAGTYASVGLPSQGTGTDAIRVAMIYKPAKVTPVGAALADADTINNRPPLAQAFAVPGNGERFAVVVNHLKSKGSCPSGGDSDASGNTDAGDGQGCWNGRRLEQAAQLRSFVATVQSTAGTQDVLLIGDFNAYGKEDPIIDLTSNGFVDQIARFDPSAYSYVFDGAAGRLDHAVSTASLLDKVVSARPWHINADEPTIIDYNLEFKQPACATCGPDYYTTTVYRSSDHDPMVVGLQLSKSVKGTDGRDTITGTSGDDMIEGGVGADTLTGGAGRDQFVYSSVLDGGDTITDFTPGEDVLVLTKLLQSLGIVSADPLGQGYVTCAATAGGSLISIDTDGSAGPLKSRALVRLLNQSCAAITAGSFKF